MRFLQGRVAMLPTLLSFGTDPGAHEFVVPALCKRRKGRGTPLFSLCQQSQKPGPPARLVSLQPKLHGGEGGIRTPDTLSGMPVFKTGAINHSATSPGTTVLLQFAPSLLVQQTESAGVELHDLGEVREEIGQAVVAGVEVILVLHAFFLQ